VLALTATAAPEVRAEIISGLHMREPKIIVRGFDRPNIFLRVDAFITEKEKQEALLKRVQFADKPGLIYAATRKHAESLAAALEEMGVDAAWYHGGMPAKERDQIQQTFMDSSSQVMVATNAFGLGVDKPDIRFVYHADVPDSLDSYYQEVGRAGRDGKPAEAVLFYRREDLRLPKFLKSAASMDEDEIVQVEQVLQNAEEPVPLETVQRETGLSPHKLARVVNNLEKTGAVERLPTGEAALSAETEDLGEAARAVQQEEQRYKERNTLRLAKMQAYAELRDCRREYLLEYFADEDIIVPCNRCDNCEAQSARRPHSGPFPVHSRVVHKTFGKGIVQGYDAGKIEVLFEDQGLKRMSFESLMKKGLLRIAS
jgi:ATP-dependent DNA helicase RecQ